ncbi:hypothetical protein LXA52_17860, partial [Erwinia amylovora]|uniref:hypothetical protein n=1 Tax=Erwinia amylovora TaxID=552 RepID=UPI0020C18091
QHTKHYTHLHHKKHNKTLYTNYQISKTQKHLIKKEKKKALTPPVVKPKEKTQLKVTGAVIKQKKQPTKKNKQAPSQ